MPTDFSLHTSKVVLAIALIAILTFCPYEWVRFIAASVAICAVYLEGFNDGEDAWIFSEGGEEENAQP